MAKRFLRWGASADGVGMRCGIWNSLAGDAHRGRASCARAIPLWCACHSAAAKMQPPKNRSIKSCILPKGLLFVFRNFANLRRIVCDNGLNYRVAIFFPAANVIKMLSPQYVEFIP